MHRQPSLAIKSWPGGGARRLENQIEVYRKFAIPLITKVLELAKGWELDKSEFSAIQKVLNSDDLFLAFGYWSDNQKPFNFYEVKKDEVSKVAKELAGLSKSSPDYFEVILIDKDGHTFEVVPKVEYTDYVLINLD